MCSYASLFFWRVRMSRSQFTLVYDLGPSSHCWLWRTLIIWFSFSSIKLLTVYLHEEKGSTLSLIRVQIWVQPLRYIFCQNWNWQLHLSLSVLPLVVPRGECCEYRNWSCIPRIKTLEKVSQITNLLTKHWCWFLLSFYGFCDLMQMFYKQAKKANQCCTIL